MTCSGIGKGSQQADYEIDVELDDKLDGAAIQHREVQEAESELFLGYFGGKLMYLPGGAASGFKSVEAESRPTRLFQVKGRANNMLLKEVKVRRDAMNSGDVFILDCEGGGAPLVLRRGVRRALPWRFVRQRETRRPR